MRSYDCEPVSSPKLPPTHNHPMWRVCIKELLVLDYFKTCLFIIYMNYHFQNKKSLNSLKVLTFLFYFYSRGTIF